MITQNYKLFVYSRFYMKGSTWFPLVVMGRQNFLNPRSSSWPKCSWKDKVWKIGTLPATFQHSEIKCSCSQRTLRLDVSIYGKKKLKARNGKCSIHRHSQSWFPAVLVSPHHDIALQWNQWKEISKLQKSNRWGRVCTQSVTMVDANGNVVALTERNL